jgi:enterochelin esterase-like enzyme
MKCLRLVLLVLFMPGLSACAPVNFPVSTPAANEPVPTAETPSTPSPTLPPTATSVNCLNLPGQLIPGALDTMTPPQQYLIYLPPCYGQNLDQRYPVLYLLHGQLSTDSQWVDLGAPPAADSLISSGAAPPFIIVLPDDRYWNLPTGDGFGDRLIHDIIPFIDGNYRTLADRTHRALGGLSRGGGWAVHILLTRYDLFGSIGLHSAVIFDDDARELRVLVPHVPADAWPRLWIDAGDHDGGLGKIQTFEALLSAYEVPHEWRMYTGDHTNPYWHAHVTEYLQWYADGFQESSSPVPTTTPAP